MQEEYLRMKKEEQANAQKMRECVHLPRPNNANSSKHFPDDAHIAPGT